MEWVVIRGSWVEGNRQAGYHYQGVIPVRQGCGGLAVGCINKIFNSDQYPDSYYPHPNPYLPPCHHPSLPSHFDTFCHRSFPSRGVLANLLSISSCLIPSPIHFCHTCVPVSPTFIATGSAHCLLVTHSPHISVSASSPRQIPQQKSRNTRPLAPDSTTASLQPSTADRLL